MNNRNEVFMLGGLRLLTFLVIGVGGLAAIAFAEDSHSGDYPVPSGPPKAKVAVVEDTVHGHKIVDPYRYLENANDPDTKLYVEQELSYTRSILDSLPGRDKINARLSQLIAIGTVGAPQMGGKYYFHTRRDGDQDQPVLYVREGVNGAPNSKDRVLVDVNKMAADATIALDWWYASEDGKFVAYGTSASGSEQSTLHIVETATGKSLPDSIERTSAASLVWKLDNSGFFYTRYPSKGDVAAGQEVYNRHVFYHALGADSTQDKLIFGEGLDPQWWPDLTLSEDDRWLLINIAEGWTKSEMYLLDLQSKNPPEKITAGREFL